MRMMLLAGFILVLAGAVNSQEMRPVGVARVDITPDYAIRLCGYAARKTPSEGVEQKLWAKAMAIGGDDEVARRMEQKFKLPRERFVLCSSHSHCAPCLSGALVNMFGYRLPDDQLGA